jgi:biotin synthase-like enzyme
MRKGIIHIAAQHRQAAAARKPVNLEPSLLRKDHECRGDCIYCVAGILSRQSRHKRQRHEEQNCDLIGYIKTKGAGDYPANTLLLFA